MGIAPKEPTQYETTKSCTCPEGRCQCGKTHFADDDTIAYIARLEAELALAREALEYYADPNYNGHNANSKCAKIALSTLTTGNAVSQIEARALRTGADECRRLWKLEADAAANGTQSPKYHDAIECAAALDALAEQKEQP